MASDWLKLVVFGWQLFVASVVGRFGLLVAQLFILQEGAWSVGGREQLPAFF